MIRYGSFLQNLAARVSRLEASMNEFGQSRTTLQKFITTLDAAAGLQYYPSVGSHAQRIIRILEDLEPSFTTEEFYHLRTHLEYITAARGNPIAQMEPGNMDPDA